MPLISNDSGTAKYTSQRNIILHCVLHQLGWLFRDFLLQKTRYHLYRNIYVIAVGDLDLIVKQAVEVGMSCSVNIIEDRKRLSWISYQGSTTVVTSANGCMKLPTYNIFNSHFYSHIMLSLFLTVLFKNENVCNRFMWEVV